jgi:hypothetical protein
VLRNRGANITLLASMSPRGGDGIVPIAVEDATTASAFETLAGQALAPSLRSRQIVVMDNLNAQTTEKVTG